MRTTANFIIMCRAATNTGLPAYMYRTLPIGSQAGGERFSVGLTEDQARLGAFVPGPKEAHYLTLTRALCVECG